MGDRKVPYKVLVGKHGERVQRPRPKCGMILKLINKWDAAA